ncbi:MAG: kelch repeat-containing protein [bacterium]
MRSQRNIARLFIATLALASLGIGIALIPIRWVRAQTVEASWTFTGSLSAARHGHTATLLKTGKVLIAGGLGAGFLSGSELYDPATGTWSTTGALNKPRAFCTATLIQDGRVLVVGGFTNNNPQDFGIKILQSCTTPALEPGVSPGTSLMIAPIIQLPCLKTERSSLREVLPLGTV